MNTQAGKENEGKMAEPREPDRVVAVLNSNGRLGTVYKQVSRTLARQGGWRRKGVWEHYCPEVLDTPASGSGEVEDLWMPGHDSEVNGS